MRLWCLVVSYYVRNRNKVKNFIFVESNLELCKIGNTNIHMKINVSDFINKLVPFVFCEFNSVTS